MKIILKLSLDVKRDRGGLEGASIEAPYEAYSVTERPFDHIEPHELRTGFVGGMMRGPRQGPDKKEREA